MAVMRKTYILLCVVGLCTTLFVIHITYGDSRRPITQANNKNAVSKFSNNITRWLTLTSNKVERFTPTDTQSDEYSNFSEIGNSTLKNFQQQLPRRTIHLSNELVDEENSLFHGAIEHINKNIDGDKLFDSNKNMDVEKLYRTLYRPMKPTVDSNEDNIMSKLTSMDAKNNPPAPSSPQQNADHIADKTKQMMKDFNEFKKEMQTNMQTNNHDTKSADLVLSKIQPVLPEVETKLPLDVVKPISNGDPKCEPKDNIMLLKTHKCSSSTMQNILYRWGDARNLSFVLPKGSMPYLGSPALFDKKYAIESADEVYNILANHARFNEKGISTAMPSNTVYISILRNPTTQYESLYNYYKHQDRYGADLAQFLANPAMYFHHEPANTHIVGRNSMLFDLGLDARYLEGSSSKVAKWIQKLDKRFDLVLIAEYFSESLILLKDLLCWTMDDIVYLNQNARSASSVRKLTRSMEQGIMRWNGGDVNLYNYFNQTLWKKIAAYGIERMKKDVDLLNAKNEEVKRDCVASTLKSGDPRMWYPPGVKMESFKMNPNAKNKLLCDRVTRPELTYMKYLADKQRKRNIQLKKSKHKQRT